MSVIIPLNEPVTLSTFITSLEPQWGDLILIQHRHRPLHDEPIYELAIVGTNQSNASADLDLIVMPPEDWILLRKAVIRTRIMSEWTMGPLQLAPPLPRDRTIDAGAIITLRPSNKTILDCFFNGNCPYERCQHGIVLVTPSSISDLSLMQSSRSVHLTLCPFCMGIDILREHEELVRAVANVTMLESATEELLRDSELRSHRHRVNDIRLEMGYAALPIDPGLFGLGVQSGGGGDDIEVASLVDYLDSVARSETVSPSIETSTLVTDFGQPLTRTPGRGGHLASAPRGRTGRRAQGRVEYRRTSLDPRPGSGYTHEVSLVDDEQLAEATILTQEYHRTLMGPPPPLAQQIGDESTAARDITEEDEISREDAVVRAFDNTDPITHTFHPGTPRPPPLPERPTSLHGRVICSETFKWYQSIQERVVGDICPICLESFASGLLLITALPCGHFFHEECIRGRRRERMTVTCPYRCEGLIRM